MTYSRENGPQGARNLQMIVSEVAPYGREIAATEIRVGGILSRYENELMRSVSKGRHHEVFARLLTPGYAGVQEFALLVQNRHRHVESFKQGTDDSVLRSIFCRTLQSAMSEVETGLKRFRDGPWDEETGYREEQWVKRKTKLQGLLDELVDPQED